MFLLLYCAISPAKYFENAVVEGDLTDYDCNYFQVFSSHIFTQNIDKKLQLNKDKRLLI